MDLLTPTVHSHHTHKSSALPEGSLGGLPSLSLSTKGAWIHLWGVLPSLSSALRRQYPQLLLLLCNYSIDTKRYNQKMHKLCWFFVLGGGWSALAVEQFCGCLWRHTRLRWLRCWLQLCLWYFCHRTNWTWCGCASNSTDSRCWRGFPILTVRLR